MTVSRACRVVEAHADARVLFTLSQIRYQLLMLSVSFWNGVPRWMDQASIVVISAKVDQKIFQQDTNRNFRRSSSLR